MNAKISREVGSHAGRYQHAINVSTTILSLPEETLSQILEDTVSEWSKTVEALLFPQRAFALAVSGINRRLRNVALNTPSLWRKIFMWQSRPLAIIDIYLTRSKNMPLEIDIDLDHQSERRQFKGNADSPDNRPSPSPVSFRSMVRLLLPHVGRWRTLQIRAFEQQHYHILSHALESQPLTVLEKIQVDLSCSDRSQSVHDDDEVDIEDRRITHNYTSDAPSLNTLRLRECNPPLRIPLVSTRTLSLSFQKMIPDSSIIEWMTGSSLTHLVVHGHFPDHDLSSLALPALTSFHMHNTSPKHPPTCALLNRLEAPSLQLLRMTATYFPFEDIFTSSSSRFPKLTSLIIVYYGHRGNIPWRHVSTCFPFVEDFVLLSKFRDVFLRFAEMLDKGRTQPVPVHVTQSRPDPIWLGIRTLSLGFGGAQDADLQVLVDVVSRRESHGSSLHKLRLAHCLRYRIGIGRAVPRISKRVKTESFDETSYASCWPDPYAYDWARGD